MITTFREWIALREALDPQIKQEISQIDPRQLRNPQWRVDLKQLDEYERGEAERVADSYGKLTQPPTDSNGLWQKIVMAAKNPANLRVIMPQQIDSIDNFDDVHSNSLEQVVEYLESKPRDWRSILQAFQQGGSLPAPVVIVLPNGVNHLMSGNSRLMMCRALKKPAKVLFVSMNQESSATG
jgi:Fe-S-cluster formation regulator IscX/YfhJ